MLSLVAIIVTLSHWANAFGEPRRVLYLENLTSLLQQETETEERRRNTLQADIDFFRIEGFTNLMDSEVQYIWMIDQLSTSWARPPFRSRSHHHLQ